MDSVANEDIMLDIEVVREENFLNQLVDLEVRNGSSARYERL